jgi:diaminopimelate epimerase
MRFAKGHGTGNDFLILPDPDDALALSPELVARLCDRRTGLGADGVLRAVRQPRRPAGGWPERMARGGVLGGRPPGLTQRRPACRP